MTTEHDFETIMRILNTGHCAEQVRQCECGGRGGEGLEDIGQQSEVIFLDIEMLVL